MSTTTDLNTLVINYLTEAQYESAVSGGTIDPDQLYLTPETNVPVTDVEVNGVSVVTAGVASVDLTGKSDVGHTHTKTDITDFPSLATVATSGSYSDLSNKPTIPTVTDTYSGTSSNAMSGKAVKSAIDALDGTISGTAGSGKTLTAFSQTDGKVSATFGSISITKSQVSDFPSLATVATSGSYSDLSNKPTIPTITDTYSGTSSNGMSGKAVKSAIDALDGSVSGSAGSGKTLTAFSQTNGVVSATFGNISITKSQVSDFPSLATVATSGSYSDLSNKPTIPTVPTTVSSFTNDAGYITGYTETDPVFTASDAYSISSTDISNWDNAFDGNIDFDTTAVSGDDYNLTTILTTLGWLNDVIV